jgi:hypothetical protein
MWLMGGVPPPSPLPGSNSIVFKDIDGVVGCKYFITKELRLNICKETT